MMTTQATEPAQAAPMVFTLEDDNRNAPVYDAAAAQEWEAAPHNWEEPADKTAGSEPSGQAAEEMADGAPEAGEGGEPDSAPAAAPQDGHRAEEALGKALAAFRQPENEPAPPDAETVLPETPAQPVREYTPEETDYARRRYLAHLGAEHNRSVPDTDLDGNPLAQADAAVLIQEDWLAAQQALHTGQKDDFQLPVSTLKLNGLDGAAPDTPEITVNVYDAVELPVGRKVKILSEQALMEAVRERLRPHLTNVVAGLAARVLQKKTALLSYELQMTLNDEVPQAVEEVLAHHLDEIMQALKEEA